VSGRPLSAEATAALSAALSSRPDVSRAFLIPGEGSIVIEFGETAEDIEAYKAEVHELMRTVIRSLGRESRGRSLQCGPAATIGPATRGATLLYERSAS
jgi:hypothetical protein